MHRFAIAVVSLCILLIGSRDAGAEQTLRVMTFNIWVGGESGGQPLEQTVKVIREAGADIVGLQEARGEERDGKRPDYTQRIAESLGWHYLVQGGGTSIISRYPITASTPKKWGAQITLPDSKVVWLFNVHFPASPYQPYQLLNIPYNDAPFLKTADQAIAAAEECRGKQVADMLGEVRALQDTGDAVFITGDFNEPSPLDWTKEAHAAGRHPAVVEWPTSKHVLDQGFKDALREVSPDPLARPAYTWTPTTKLDDPKDHHDRIDLIYFVGKKIRVDAAEIIGENAENADKVVTPYPSDHRAVVATFTLE